MQIEDNYTIATRQPLQAISSPVAADKGKVGWQGWALSIMLDFQGSAFEVHRRPVEPIKGRREGKRTPPRESGAGGGIQTTALQIHWPSLPNSWTSKTSGRASCHTPPLSQSLYNKADIFMEVQQKQQKKKKEKKNICRLKFKATVKKYFIFYYDIWGCRTQSCTAELTEWTFAELRTTCPVQTWHSWLCIRYWERWDSHGAG